MPKSACTQSSVILWNLEEIASWQINSQEKTFSKVSMPALQRGYVWAAHQVEGLWDSLVRQLPIGAFLVSRYQDNYISHKNISNKHDAKPEFMLLDGQQRATSIALAFANPWKNEILRYPLALWVDLAKPGNNYRDRGYMFRLLTRSHPWGYRRNEIGRLESKQRKAALDAFVCSFRSYKQIDELAPLPDEAKYPGLNVTHSWPWDAISPLPFPLLWEAVFASTDWQSNLYNSIESFNFWKSPMPTQHNRKCWKERIFTLLQNKNGEEYDRLCYLADALPEVSLSTVIPGIVVPEKDMAKKLWDISVRDNTSDPEEVPPPDHVESLFVRINSAGTPLGGEELIYSTFKAIWPDSQSLVEDIGKDAFIRPATLVALTGRLVLSIEQDKKAAENNRIKSKIGEISDSERTKFPPALNVTRFRSLVHASDGEYKNALEAFMLNKAKVLFAAAREFLTGNPASDKEDYRLGALLTENLARTAPDIYFFFLRWLHDNLDQLPRQIRVRKHILGALTAIVFFAPDPTAFVARLWRRKSESWWQGSFLCSEQNMRMKNGKLIMFPLPSPKELKKSLLKVLPEKEWKNWDWYNDLARQYPKKSSTDFALRCRDMIKASENDESLRSVDMAWSSLWDKLWNERRLVLFAQRHWLDAFFPNYNPASPDQLEDSDRPFDWDHIFPQSYIYNTKRPIFKLWRYEWPHTIGNLRAWPMELNRHDGNNTPANKLSNGVEEHFDIHWKKHLPSGLIVREASFIDEKGWKYWQQCDGNDKFIKESLTQQSEFGQALLKAITERVCDLYEHWYETLEVGSCF